MEKLTQTCRVIKPVRIAIVTTMSIRQARGGWLVLIDDRRVQTHWYGLESELCETAMRTRALSTALARVSRGPLEILTLQSDFDLALQQRLQAKFPGTVIRVTKKDPDIRLAQHLLQEEITME
ncbi:hypothetical protein ACFQ22_01470 [Lentilactobacillus raoultii]|uniref:Uncharacterized protein n=1 Tax=Lentilactobacillus raoultii TaxID=1987503 RepID=A0ABW3PIK7_9LACO|nr:hypothetical protein [Lentilactobacillus raoultii]